MARPSLTYRHQKREINNFVWKPQNLLFHAQTAGMARSEAACSFNYSEPSPLEMNKGVFVLSGRPQSNYAITSILSYSSPHNVEIILCFLRKHIKPDF